ncbi:MAG: 50S ribosomal protein L9 [Candidatus Riflebacteria bacterium]|nr:50S ribosomal protein L9 [Candidatus Riflebacteria bacterium]
MEVLLVKDVDRFGRRGDRKKVSEGYARNYLLPRAYAIPISPGSLNHLKLVQASWEKKALKEKSAAQETANKIEGISVRFFRRAGEKGRLFGSVTNSEVVEMIKKETGVEVDKKHVVVDHIKELGQFDVVAKLAPDVKAKFKVLVLQEEGAASTPHHK